MFVYGQVPFGGYSAMRHCTLRLYVVTLRGLPRFVAGLCIVQECELAFFALSYFCFIFSQRPEVWHFANADCEHRQWLQKQAFW